MSAGLEHFFAAGGWGKGERGGGVGEGLSRMLRLYDLAKVNHNERETLTFLLKGFATNGGGNNVEQRKRERERGRCVLRLYCKHVAKYISKHDA